jgi:hypothetical protein
MNFWEKHLAQTPTSPVLNQGPRRAWWQDEPQQVQQTYERSQQVAQLSPHGYAAETVPNPQQEDQVFKSLLRVPADQLTPEQMEFMAEHELARPKYNSTCPQCGSGNYVPSGTKLGGVKMPTEKCFECGLSARGPEPAIGGRATGTAKSTRQIDTGGGAGSMYMTFRGIPNSYIPRG